MIRLIRPKFWEHRGFLAYLFLPISLIYFICYKIRKTFAKSKHVSRPVICVGNTIVGGGGKTPIVIAIAKYLRERSIKVAIITRGYKGSASSQDNMISVRECIDWKIVGDEALLLNAAAPTFVAKDRALAANKLSESGFDVILLDDGMQNPTLKKDLNITVIDTRIKKPFGNKMLFPAGPLRETMKDTLLHRPFFLNITDDNTKIDDAVVLYHQSIDLKNQKVWIMCGLAQPEKFIDTVKKLGGCIAGQTLFEDHHSYQNHEIQQTIEAAEEINAIVVITEKDMVKIDSIFHQYIAIIRMQILLPQSLIIEIENLLDQF